MLTSLQNPLVKEIRRLHQAKERQKQGLLLLEGTNLVEAAITKGFSFQTVLFTEAWQEKYPALAAQLKGDRQTLVSEAVLKRVATTVNPDGIVATLDQNLISTVPPESLQLGVAIERLQDPGNLGTIIRTATATGVDGLLLSEESVQPSNPKVLRASVGAWFETTPIVTPTFSEQLQRYRAQGVQIIATLPQATKTYWDIDWRQSSLILLGNEGSGLSPEIATLADHAVQIPMGPGVESLNVAIACALMLYEARRQRDHHIT
ncbi:MAG: RNA methyltransferase [Synechococcus sp.]|nr:RNA methyltransferase [Synechococcus sp.]